MVAESFTLKWGSGDAFMNIMFLHWLWETASSLFGILFRLETLLHRGT